MITLYGMGSPNVVKIYIALEELGLAYQVRPVDVFAGRQFDADFLRLNPLAKVPVVTDPEGPGGKPISVFESGAILLYLAEKTGRLLPSEPAARSAAIQWMMVQMTNVGPMCGQLVHFKRFAPGGNDYTLSRYATQVHKLFELYDQHLGTTPWAGGAEYGIADIAAFPWLRNGPMLIGDAAAQFANVQRWVTTIDARPAVRRALAAVEKVRAETTPFDKASADNLDRLFGRGQFAAA
ncbi:MAG TPA: glutathione S-transferase N-terminal domain-containing protein [Acetobacteraceae bacterium]|nr:glutathione S-transferase N-terminal domain-containing protein [Acetobacteraceae bacterium]